MIDAHHHIWRQADLPWLQGPEQPRIFGPYAAIKRDYLIDEYLADLTGMGITKSVYVQANWPPDQGVAEAAWVQQTAESCGWPHATVAYADMTVDDVRPALDRLAKFSLVRGIRQQLHWHENPLYRFASRPNLAEDETVQANIRHLADYGWSFDLQVFPAQMPSAAKLAAACPNVSFILQHAGMLEDTSAAGWAAWRHGMELLAKEPNVFSKLSAFGTFRHWNDPEFIRQMIRGTLAIFGAERCLYGSNFPIEKIWTTYVELFSAFQAAAADLPETARTAIFNGTAARVYRLADD